MASLTGDDLRHNDKEVAFEITRIASKKTTLESKSPISIFNAGCLRSEARFELTYFDFDVRTELPASADFVFL